MAGMASDTRAGSFLRILPTGASPEPGKIRAQEGPVAITCDAQRSCA